MNPTCELMIVKALALWSVFAIGAVTCLGTKRMFAEKDPDIPFIVFYAVVFGPAFLVSLFVLIHEFGG